MKTTLLNGILKAALLLLITTSFSFGQSKLMSGVQKKNNKRVYNCKHVGKQKVEIKKFNKKEIDSYVSAKKISKHNHKKIDTLNIKQEIEEAEFTAEVMLMEEKMVMESYLPLPKPVYFRFDTDELTHEDMHQIALATEHIRLGKTIIIEGHTDSHGSEHYNLALSLKRANKIKKMMVDFGAVSADSIFVKQYGEEKPAIDNDNHENRQLNRRVEFIVMQY